VSDDLKADTLISYAYGRRKTGKSKVAWEGDAFVAFDAPSRKMTMVSEEGKMCVYY
jgi:hypothetical protein